MRDQRNIAQLREEIAELTKKMADPARNWATVETMQRMREKKQHALDILLRSNKR